METDKKENKKCKKEKEKNYKHWRWQSWQSKVIFAIGCFAIAISSFQIAY